MTVQPSTCADFEALVHPCAWLMGDKGRDHLGQAVQMSMKPYACSLSCPQHSSNAIFCSWPGSLGLLHGCSRLTAMLCCLQG